jgi:heat shock protein HslJ
MRNNLIGVALLVTLAAACTGAPPAEQADVVPPAISGNAPTLLVGTYWRLLTIGEETIESGMPVAYLLLQDAEKRFGGNAGCNRYGGTYNLVVDSLSFGPAISTKMACAGPGMETEQMFLAILPVVHRYRIEGDRLSLLSAERVVATFVANDSL